MNNHDKALETARKKGAAAALAGLEESACPYRDKRTYLGRFTWSRVWRAQWLAGFRTTIKAGRVAPPEKAAEKSKGATMAKAKKKKPARRAKKRPVRTKRPAPIVRETPPEHTGPLYDHPEPTTRDVALPELWLKIEKPVCVRFVEKMRADTSPVIPGARKRPAMLAKVHEYEGGNTDILSVSPIELAMPAPLASVFASIPLDGYVGRSYWITRHRRHERKNASGFTVVEMQPTKTGEAAT